MTSERHLRDIKRDANIGIKGVNNQITEVETTGTHDIFGVESLLIEEAPTEILSLAQHVKNFYLKYLQNENIFVTWEKGDNPKYFFLFVEKDGMYGTNTRHSFDSETIPEAMQTLLDSRKNDANEKIKHKLVLLTKRNKLPESYVPVSEEQDSNFAKRMMSNKTLDYNKDMHKQVMVIRRLHCTLGHIGKPAMINMIEHVNKRIKENRLNECNSVNMKEEMTKEATDMYFRIFENCVPCNIAKMQKDENQERNSLPFDKIGSQVNIDLTFIGGDLFFLTTIDLNSKFAHITWIKSKNARVVYGALKLVVQQYAAMGHKVEVISSDRDKSFKKELISDMGIFLVKSPPEGHNSSAEIHTRYIWDMVRAIRADLPYNMPKLMYRRIFEWAFNMHNFRVRADTGISPFFKFFKKDYNLNLLQIPFGMLVVSAIKNNTDWEQKANVGIVVGLDPNSINCFQFLCLETYVISTRSTWKQVDDPEKYYNRINQLADLHPFEYDDVDEPATWEEDENEIIEMEKKDIIFSKDMVVDQNTIYVIENLGERYLKKFSGKKSVWMVHTKWLGYVHDSEWDQSQEQLIKERGYSYAQINALKKRSTEDDESENLLKILISLQQEALGENGENSDDNQITIEDILLNTENMTIKQALNSDHPIQAEKSMEDEIGSILGYDTWDCIHFKNIPLDRRKDILNCFMFLKNKYGKDNLFTKIKARLVVLGNKQDISKMRPDQISASTVRFQSILAMLNIFASTKNEKGTEMVIADVHSAYLQAELETPEYMKLSPEIVNIYLKLRPEVKEFVNEKGEIYVVLKKALYGLVQSAKLWYNEVKKALAEIGYHPIHPNIDPNIFTKKLEWGTSTIAVYVDDLGIISKPGENDRILEHLQKRFGHKEGGQLKIQRSTDMMYLGIRIRIDPNSNTVTLSQHEYIEKLIQRTKQIYNITEIKLQDNPATQNLFLADDKFKTTEMNINLMIIVMSIAYLAMRTRPDLLAFVSFFVSRIYHHDPEDKKRLLCLIGYIIKTKDKVLTLNSKKIEIVGLSDASYLNHANTSSQMGLVVGLGFDEVSGSITGLVYAVSKKVKRTAHSTAEAELMAQAEVLKTILWLKYLLEELGYETQTNITIYQDNESAIVMGNQGYGNHKKSKHIHKDEFAVHEYKEEGIVILRHLKSELMIADILTKPLTGSLLKIMTSRILNEKIINLPITKTKKSKNLKISSLLL